MEMQTQTQERGQPGAARPARPTLMGLTLTLTLILTGRGVQAQGWIGYGSDAQHSCKTSVASQLPQVVRWKMPVDTNPPFNNNNDLLIHYASPLVTRKNNVIVTTRTGAGFQVSAVNGLTGLALWKAPLTTDYILPPHNWIPSCGSTLASDESRLAIPGAGGTIYLRTNPDRATGTVSQVAFYGNSVYAGAPGTYNAQVFVCTPITTDAQGNFYFGFVVIGPPPGGLPSGGLARVGANGTGSFVSAATAAGDANMKKVAYNCAPALSSDGLTVYVAVNNKADGTGGYGTGYLTALDSTSLAHKASIALKDPATGSDALVSDDGTATPTVGSKDGDVYYGVLESNLPSGNNDRGWMLHFSGDLSTSKTPGAFGWDDTASIVDATLVQSYNGPSKYLILTKYNNYADFGYPGTGNNQVAILDPNDTQSYTSHGGATLSVMKEVITVMGITPNSSLPGVREWCINSAAIDAVNRCALLNSEDGNLYRWSFDNNSLSPALPLAAATGEAYTPTVIGPDGAVYAINRAMLNCCIAKPLPSRTATPPGATSPASVATPSSPPTHATSPRRTVTEPFSGAFPHKP